MRRKNPTTLRGWSAKYRRDMKAVQQVLDAVQHKLAVFELRAERSKLREEINWSDYDRAVDATTSAEVELFMASPAYKHYQEMRRARVAQQSRPQFAGEEAAGVQGFTPLSGRTPP